MAEETQYTARNGIAVISTANSNLDGTGTLGTLLTGGSNGTLIKNVWIKAQATTTEGTLRLFLSGGGNTRLLREIHVPPVTPSATDKSFEIMIPMNFTLQSGYVLKAATQNAEPFGIIAEGMEWAYYSSGVRLDTTKYTAITGLNSFSTANTKLDGTGTLALLYNYNSPNGITIDSITIKSIVDNTSGMVRLFLQNPGATVTVLWMEIPVPANTKSGKWPAFEHTINFPNDFELESNYTLYSSTEKSETFKSFVSAVSRSYAA